MSRGKRKYEGVIFSLLQIRLDITDKIRFRLLTKPGWVDPSQHPNTHKDGHSLPSLAGWGENNEKVRGLRGLIEWGKDSLIRKINAKNTIRAKKELIH